MNLLLVAPGLFQRTLDESGADVVSAPLVDHDAVIDLVKARFHAAGAVLSRTA